ncbi:MAG: stage II sporulation protein P [Clostridia bacterium]|nr:stage II sporulation protein P [Clostridia bacterium]
MKEKIKTVKSFICFYMTLPLFVFMILSTGIRALGEVPAEKAESDMEYDMEEYEILPSENIRGEASNPDGTFPIIIKDLSKDYDILNSTDEVVDEATLLSYPLPSATSKAEPVVLVVHTHGTECYADESESFASADQDGYYGFYTTKSQTRTTDTENNMIAIGEAFCKVLAENGIQSIQCRIMHDKDDYNSAYSNSRKSIKKYLEKYPSIQYVIDIHRDSLGGDGGEKIKTMASELEECAQVMLVAGCNGKGVVYPDWESNLSLALKYKEAMDNKYPSLSRPIYLRYSRYNLDLTTGSLLLEVGSCANTFKEALKAAELAAECFAEMLK